MIDLHQGDSLALGIQLMRSILKNIGSNGNRSYFFYCLGKGLIKQGKVNEGEAMLDSMYKDISQIKDAKYAKGVLEYMIDHYLARENASKVMQYASFYRKQSEVLFNEQISQKVASAMIKYQTEKKEQQLKLTVAELSIKDLRIQLYVTALVLLFLVIVGGILWYLHERKLQKKREWLIKQEKAIAQREWQLAENLLHEEKIQLERALENLREANLESEQVHELFNEFMAHCENQQNIALITPSVFREKGEVKFRRYFMQLYPTFLNLLKERIPDITRGEEILCMLIVLGQNMDEVADILCIEKKSVKMSRYRLRKKIGITQEESLEDFIRSLL